MLDQKKIELLKQCLSASCRGFRNCPYNDTVWNAIETVLELLAEQEHVEPRWFTDVHHPAGAFVCGACGERIVEKNFDFYCPKCGKAVKWDD